MKRTPISEMHELAADDGEPRVRFKIEVCNGETCMALEHPGYLRWDELDLSALEKFVQASRDAAREVTQWKGWMSPRGMSQHAGLVYPQHRPEPPDLVPVTVTPSALAEARERAATWMQKYEPNRAHAEDCARATHGRCSCGRAEAERILAALEVEEGK